MKNKLEKDNVFFISNINNHTFNIFSINYIFRILKKKEDKKRFKEKFCFPSKKRVNGNLIWFHGASVGEILSIIPLLKNLKKINL